MENTQTFTQTTRKEEWKRKVGYIPRVSGEGGGETDGRWQTVGGVAMVCRYVDCPTAEWSEFATT